MNVTTILARGLVVVGTSFALTCGQAATAQATWADINAQQKSLGYRVTTLLSQGKISATQAAKFRADLDSISAREVKFKSDPGGGRTERAALSKDLDALSTGIEAAVTAASSADVSGYAARRADLEKRFNDGIAKGKVGRMERNELRKDLDFVAEREAAARKTGERLTANEIAKLNDALDRVERKLKEMVKDEINYAERADDRLRKIADRIKDGVSRGKLNAAEATRLRVESDRLSKVAATQKTSNGVMDINEWESLRLELQKLNRQVKSQTGDNSADDEN